MRRAPSISTGGLTWRGDGLRAVERDLADEAPVAFVFHGTTLAVMLATPADIEDLAIGFALSEGVITTLAQIDRFDIVEHAQGIEAQFWLTEDRGAAFAARHRAMAGPVGCGLCGIDSLEQAMRALPVVTTDPRLSMADIAGATDGLRAYQTLHDKTGATHAAGFLRPGQGIVVAREDVGRHNGLDKLIGALARGQTHPGQGAFVLTSRVSVELVQKAAVAGCPVLIAVSAPTAHACQVADAAGITLVAQARDGAFDVYTHANRITNEVPDVA